MPNKNTDADSAIHKLGKRLREGWAKKHPVPDQSIETVRNTVRQDWEQEQEASRENKPKPDVAKEQQRQPPEPDQER
jgi:hypothetical protein